VTTSLTFAPQAVGTTSSVQFVTVTNNGSAPLTFTKDTVDRRAAHAALRLDYGAPPAIWRAPVLYSIVIVKYSSFPSRCTCSTSGSVSFSVSNTARSASTLVTGSLLTE